MIHAFHAGQVDRYFAGSLGPAAVSRMFRRLWRCETCRARYERHLVYERSLPDGLAAGEERLWQSILASADRAADSARVSTFPRALRRVLSRPATLLGAGAFAAAALWAVVGRPPHPLPGVLSRGSSETETTLSPTLHLFRSIGEHATEAVDRTVHPNDGILIAYSNPSADLAFLMVFAVDVHGDVHWYYPAYERAGENPAAPAIRTRALGVELNEEIRHPLPVGPLRVFALFLRRPLLVDEVERQVSEAWNRHGQSPTAVDRLPLADGRQVSRLLEVTP